MVEVFAGGLAAPAELSTGANSACPLLSTRMGGSCSGAAKTKGDGVPTPGRKYLSTPLQTSGGSVGRNGKLGIRAAGVEAAYRPTACSPPSAKDDVVAYALANPQTIHETCVRGHSSWAMSARKGRVCFVNARVELLDRLGPERKAFEGAQVAAKLPSRIARLARHCRPYLASRTSHKTLSHTVTGRTCC